MDGCAGLNTPDGVPIRANFKAPIAYRRATVSAHTSAPSPVVSSSAVRMAACRSPSPRPIGLVVPSGVDVFHRKV